jgi:hypothetical protein
MRTALRRMAITPWPQSQELLSHFPLPPMPDGAVGTVAGGMAAGGVVAGGAAAVGAGALGPGSRSDSAWAPLHTTRTAALTTVHTPMAATA